MLGSSNLSDRQCWILQCKNKSSVVIGGVMTGKTTLALCKALQLSQENRPYFFIEKSYVKYLYLKAKIQELGLPIDVQYFNKWLETTCINPVDYLIVDDVQNFDRVELHSLCNKCRYRYFLFLGSDDASVYDGFHETLNMEEITHFMNGTHFELYNDFKFKDPLCDVPQYLLHKKDCVSLSNKINRIRLFKLEEIELQAKFIVDTIIRNGYSDRNVGILVYDNQSVKRMYDLLESYGLRCERNYYDPKEKKRVNSLNFRTKLPKVMTYFQSAGLRFDMVFMPNIHDKLECEMNKIYSIAMTRADNYLYLLYSNTYPKEFSYFCESSDLSSLEGGYFEGI